MGIKTGNTLLISLHSLLFQIAIGTDDVYKTAEAVREGGGKITREPGPLEGLSTKITACLDPDGWKTVSGWGTRKRGYGECDGIASSWV